MLDNFFNKLATQVAYTWIAKIQIEINSGHDNST